MPTEGPLLEALLRRVIECPPEFWETCATRKGQSKAEREQLCAIVCDHFRAMQPDLQPNELTRELACDTANVRGLMAVLAWLLHDDWFLERVELIGGMQRLFRSPRLATLAALVEPQKLVADVDRREELVRICLAELDLLPAGESTAQAADRLTTLDSVERERVLRATLAAERRARAIREEMAKAKAQESASRYGE